MQGSLTVYLPILFGTICLQVMGKGHLGGVHGSELGSYQMSSFKMYSRNLNFLQVINFKLPHLSRKVHTYLPFI